MAKEPENNDAPTGRKRDAARSRRAILDAALTEFAAHGHAGARIDAIAERAGVSKPMLYLYFGDKDGLYAAALKEAYVQIREGERALDLEAMEPEAAIGALVSFTLRHFNEKPWFISMLNGENLRGGQTIRELSDLVEVQSTLLSGLKTVLQRGSAAGHFRSDITAADLYIAIAGLCYFPISNQHTLRAVFNCPVDADWLAAHEARVQQMVLAYLRPA